MIKKIFLKIENIFVKKTFKNKDKLTGRLCTTWTSIKFLIRPSSPLRSKTTDWLSMTSLHFQLSSLKLLLSSTLTDSSFPGRFFGDDSRTEKIWPISARTNKQTRAGIRIMFPPPDCTKWTLLPAVHILYFEVNDFLFTASWILKSSGCSCSVEVKFIISIIMNDCYNYDVISVRLARIIVKAFMFSVQKSVLGWRKEISSSSF